MFHVGGQNFGRPVRVSNEEKCVHTFIIRPITMRRLQSLCATLLVSYVQASSSSKQAILPSKRWMRFASVETTTPNDTRKMDPRLCRLLYALTSVNPVLSVLTNQYTGIRHFRPVMVLQSSQEFKDPLPKQIYRSIFYFARLRPRLLFAIGACARALQQTTVLQLVFDPRVGVGFGLNVLALITKAQWPAPLVLGWATSASAWRYLHAEPPVSGDAINFPINVVGLGSSRHRKHRE